MASFEHSLAGDVDAFVAHVDAAITSGSVTASIGGGSDRRIGDARMVTRVYERYSATGGNRVSLTVAVLAHAGRLEVAAITSGGSTGLFFKVNVFGEEAFLQRAVDAVTSFPSAPLPAPPS